MAGGISPNPGACRPEATPAALTGELLDEPDNAPIPTIGINGHCMVTSVNSTCSTVVTITLIDSPTTVGNYEAQINTDGGGAGQLRTRRLITAEG